MAGRSWRARDRDTAFLNTGGTGQWTTGPASGYGQRDYGSAVMYEPGKILLVGGGYTTATAEVIDLNAGATWRPVAAHVGCPTATQCHPPCRRQGARDRRQQHHRGSILRRPTAGCSGPSAGIRQRRRGIRSHACRTIDSTIPRRSCSRTGGSCRWEAGSPRRRDWRTTIPLKYSRRRTSTGSTEHLPPGP